MESDGSRTTQSGLRCGRAIDRLTGPAAGRPAPYIHYTRSSGHIRARTRKHPRRSLLRSGGYHSCTEALPTPNTHKISYRKHSTNPEAHAAIMQCSMQTAQDNAQTWNAAHHKVMGPLCTGFFPRVGRYHLQRSGSYTCSPHMPLT